MPVEDYNRLQRVLAKNVRIRREQLELTQEAAAHLMGIATRHLQKLEAGELNVTLRTLCRVAKALESQVGLLLTDSEIQPSASKGKPK